MPVPFGGLCGPPSHPGWAFCNGSGTGAVQSVIKNQAADPMDARPAVRHRSAVFANVGDAALTDAARVAAASRPMQALRGGRVTLMAAPLFGFGTGAVLPIEDG